MFFLESTITKVKDIIFLYLELIVVKILSQSYDGLFLWDGTRGESSYDQGFNDMSAGED